MGIESGPSGGGSGGGPSGGIGGGVGAVASVGSGIEGGGLARAASVSGSSIAAPSLEAASAVVGPIINEGPVGRSFLENTMPLQVSKFDPVGEIRFNNEPLSVQAVIAEAEAIISQAQKPAVQHITPIILSSPRRRGSISELEFSNWIPPFGGMTEVVEPAIFSKVEPMVVPDEFIHGHTLMRSYTSTGLRLSPVFSPALEPVTIKASTAVEGDVVSGQAILQQIAFKEQKIEEVVTADTVEQDQKEAEEEEEITERKIYLEDGEVSAQRKQEIREAVIKAKIEADRLGLKKITGALVARFLPAEHGGIRSQVVKKTGPDGSYQETVEAIAGTGELESEEKAVERFDGIVAEKKPVKYGKNGIPVGSEDVARVFKYKLVKPAQAHIEVIRRVVKKSKISFGQSAGFDPELSPKSVNTIPPPEWTEVRQEGVKLETNLEDLGLAEIFGVDRGK